MSLAISVMQILSVQENLSSTAISRGGEHIATFTIAGNMLSDIQYALLYVKREVTDKDEDALLLKGSAGQYTGIALNVNNAGTECILAVAFGMNDFNALPLQDYTRLTFTLVLIANGLRSIVTTGTFTVLLGALYSEDLTPDVPPAPPDPSTGIAEQYDMTFAQVNLVGGLLYVPHGLNTYVSGVTIWDNTDETVLPDAILRVSNNQIVINLESFVPIAGTWRVSVTA